MKHAWIVLYQMPDGILYTYGLGHLIEPPHLPNHHPTDSFLLNFEDVVLVCVYDITIQPENARFMAQSAYNDGIFRENDV